MMYKYNEEYQTLQQWNDSGTLISCMSMPRSDLSLIAKLNDNLKNLKNVDSKEEFDV